MGVDQAVDSAQATDARSQIKSVGVIGAGQMGNGIAHVVSLAGYDVSINDIEEARYHAAIETIRKNMTRQVTRGSIAQADMEAAIGRIRFVPDFTGLEDCDLWIEAATEDEDVKRQIFNAIQPHVKDTALVASNTSSISITRLAAQTERPEQFIGMHFMNPVPVMQLVELIRGIATDEKTFQVSRNFTESLGKTIAVSEDFPAFIVNRILLQMINEAV